MDIVAKDQIDETDQIDKIDQKNQPSPSVDSWVKVNPDEPDYQRLHLCKYLADLPDLSLEQEPDDMPTE